jgi:hypothetical protein
MAALAVSAAMELKRWQPSRDFMISNGALALSSTGRARCPNGNCVNTQALLDFQKSAANGQVAFPGGVTLSSDGLRSRLVAKFEEQKTCEARVDNHRGDDCPVEEHVLTFQYSEAGSCDTNFWFEAKRPDGQPLQYPAQLKNKLLWVDHTNPYVAFQSVGDMVSIDPTYGLNPGGSASSGSCSVACTKVSSSNLAGQCCSCNGASKAYSRSPWNANTYLCK